MVNNVTENITVTSDASNPVNVTEGIHAKMVVLNL